MSVNIVKEAQKIGVVLAVALCAWWADKRLSKGWLAILFGPKTGR